MALDFCLLCLSSLSNSSLSLSLPFSLSTLLPSLSVSLPPSLRQIFMRYGRQRWKLKGKIEVNSRQSWDGEEMIFTPLITDLINIKVHMRMLYHMMRLVS